MNSSTELSDQKNDVLAIAFVNFKSGGRKGKVITNILKQEIGTANVYNLAETNPHRVLTNLASTYTPESPNLPASLHIIACGGDGTVNWVLSTVSLLTSELTHLSPRCGILPLGTGNDTSRQFGWGKRITSDITVRRRIRKMMSSDCPSKPFDRWTVILTHKAGVSMHPLLDRMPIVDKKTYDNLFNTNYIHDSLKPIENGNTNETAVVSHIVASKTSSPTSNTANTDNTDNSDIRIEIESSTPSPETEKIAKDISLSVERIEDNILQPATGPLRSGLSNSPREAENHQYIHRLCSFNNYFSFGIDAQIMAAFHQQRESCSWLFCCRCCSMSWVGIWSPLNCCLSCGSIPMHLRLSVLQKNEVVEKNLHNGANTTPMTPTGVRNNTSEGTSITKRYESFGPNYSWVPTSLTNNFLDDQSALILLNIPSYAGGRDIWGAKKEEELRRKALKSSDLDMNGVPNSTYARDTLYGASSVAAKSSDHVASSFPASINDGMLELCSFSSYFHMNNTVLELPGSRSTRLDQVSGLRIAINEGFSEYNPNANVGTDNEDDNDNDDDDDDDDDDHNSNYAPAIPSNSSNKNSRKMKVDTEVSLPLSASNEFEIEQKNNNAVYNAEHDIEKGTKRKSGGGKKSGSGEKLKKKPGYVPYNSSKRPGIYIQMDGEAWVQDSGFIELVRAQSVQMLVNDDE